MASLFVISPPLHKINKKTKSPEQTDEIECLTLNPFGKIPKILFDNIVIGCTAKRSIILRNPTKKPMQVRFTKLTPDERQLTLNWYNNEIPPENDLMLELEWCPRIKGGWRDTIKLEGDGRIRKDIPITFKAISPKTNKKKGPPSCVLRKKSPIKKFSPKKFLSPKRKSLNNTPAQHDSLSIPMNNAYNSTPVLPKGKRNTNSTLDRHTFVIPKIYAQFRAEELPLATSSTNILKDITNPSIHTPKGPFIPPIISTISKDNSKANDHNLYVNRNEYLNISSATNVKEVSWSSECKENVLKSNITYVKTPCKKPNNTVTNFIDAKKSTLSVKSCNKNTFILKESQIFSPSVVSTLATTSNPFINMNVMCDPSWVKLQENNFKKWLNSLLTPPDELVTDCDMTIDIAKVWDNSIKKQYVPDAPSKELVCNKYHTKAKLDLLRNRAISFYNCSEISEVLTKLSNLIANEKLEIRSDKNMHMDLHIRTEIMRLFFSYNPLWLRIALETIYGVIIPLRSNSDVYGLGSFIIYQFFNDYNFNKYKTMFDEKYSKNLKKQMLKTFLSLIFFLDKAKEKKIIQHDPCLFTKNAPFKESRDILIQFAKETISSVGDITKHLRNIGYNLSHKQKYIEEYNFAVTDLHSDLRNGVILARVMEIILLTEGITQQLRVPTVSLLQKIHNVKLSFDVLLSNNFTILGNITPKDIVTGDKEKTLSFLWQIVHQFQIPRLNKAATLIQNWYRCLFIIIQRRILKKQFIKKENSAIIIQRWYRKGLILKKLEYLKHLTQLYIIHQRREKAAIKIQAYWKMYSQKRKYGKILNSVKSIQKNAKRLIVQRHVKQKRAAIIMIQATFKGFLKRKKYCQLKHAAITIENYYIATKLMKDERAYYLKLKAATITMQTRYRALKTMKKQREAYLSVKTAVIIIQTTYRNFKLTSKTRHEYLNLKGAAITLQREYRAKLSMKKERTKFLQMKRSVLLIEAYYLNFKLRTEERRRFLALKTVTLKLQQIYRKKKTVPEERRQFLLLKKATVFIQQKYRSNMLAQKEYYNFLNMKASAIRIQRWFRTVLEKRKEIRARQMLAATKIQALYRGFIVRKHTSSQILKIKEKLQVLNATAKVEETLGMRRERLIKNILSGNLNALHRHLEELELITSLCKTSCEILSNKELNCHIFCTALGAIKSLPEQAICITSLKILINICKHSEIIMANTWQPIMMEKLLDLMVYYCDKDCEVFPLACTLLWLYAHVEEYKNYINTQTSSNTKIHKMYQRCIRKKNMLHISQKPVNKHFYDYKYLDLPSVTSTWGLNNKKPYAFDNCVFAVGCVADILNIKL